MVVSWVIFYLVLILTGFRGALQSGRSVGLATAGPRCSAATVSRIGSGD